MHELLEYVQTRNKTGQFGQFVDLVGDVPGYVIAIKILNWLKRQLR